MDPDRAFVDRAQHGDLDAFGELVRRHQHRMVRYLRALTAGSGSEAEDIAQDAFLRAHRALGQFRGTSTFKTWLYQIATNAARTDMARRRVDPLRQCAGTPDDETDEQPVDRLEAPGNFEAALVARDRVRRALATLPAELREAVVLRDIEGFEYRDIALALDVPMGTVESRIFRGRQRLRAALSPLAEGQAAS
jgi:RNA polymerase sigma-70 factor (ECF subfamily)